MTLVDQAERTARRLKLVDVPPFPAVALRALQLASKSDTRLSELHALICTDPAFAGEILRLANSPLYGIRSQITSTVQATILLGFERVKGLALTIAMRAYVSGSQHIPVLRASWRHSLATALIAEELAGLCRVDKDVAYTAALIHDIGRLGLSVIRPDLYSTLLQQDFEDPASVMRHERELFGMDHCEAGGQLLTDWGLPQELIDIARSHHHEDQRQRLDVLEVVHLSCRVADLAGFGFVHCTESVDYDALVGRLAERSVDHVPPKITELSSRVARKMDYIESQDKPGRLEPNTFQGTQVTVGLRLSQ
jgi:putative nucleotidyltransferase with HDIG domain